MSSTAKALPASTAPAPADALAPDERAFLLRYLANGRNGTQAYADLHPGSDRPSSATAAWRWLRKAEMRAELAKLDLDYWKAQKMEADEALGLISLRARFQVGDLYDESGKLLPVNEWPEPAQRCVKSIKPGPFGDTVVLYDGLRAAELMAQAAGKLKQTLDVNHFDHLAHLAALTPDPDAPKGQA